MFFSLSSLSITKNIATSLTSSSEVQDTSFVNSNEDCYSTGSMEIIVPCFFDDVNDI